MLIKAYIDTNILIDYCWLTFFSGKKRRSNSVVLVNKGAMGQFDMHISFYSLMELSNHFTNYFLEQKAIKEGYSYPESLRERKRFELEDSERRTISELVERLRESEFLTYIDVAEVTEKFFSIVKTYLDNYVEFVDAYHLRTAIEVGCDYIVTKDSGFRKRVQDMKRGGIIGEPTQITTVSGFLKILRKTLKTRDQRLIRRER